MQAAVFRKAMTRPDRRWQVAHPQALYLGQCHLPPFHSGLLDHDDFLALKSHHRRLAIIIDTTWLCLPSEESSCTIYAIPSPCRYCHQLFELHICNAIIESQLFSSFYRRRCRRQPLGKTHRVAKKRRHTLSTEVHQFQQSSHLTFWTCTEDGEVIIHFCSSFDTHLYQCLWGFPCIGPHSTCCEGHYWQACATVVHHPGLCERQCVWMRVCVRARVCACVCVIHSHCIHAHTWRLKRFCGKKKMMIARERTFAKALSYLKRWTKPLN